MTESTIIPFETRTPRRQHLAAIVSATTAAITPEKLISDRLSIEPPGERLLLDGKPFASTVSHPLDFTSVNKITVIGGGKAAAGLAAGIERMLGDKWLKSHRLKGLVSVPSGCHVPLQKIEVRETRANSANLPTPAVLDATGDMLDMLGKLNPNDLAIVLVTGGGSALLEAPVPDVSLEVLCDLTQQMSTQGADIISLNTIRQLVSRVKGGGLATAARAGRLLALVISDIIGDPLQLIASGPCLPSMNSPSAIKAILERHSLPTNVQNVVLSLAQTEIAGSLRQPTPDGSWITPNGCQVDHLLLGSNATAISAASAAAARCGYEVAAAVTDRSNENAEEVGCRLADQGIELLATACQLGRPLAMIEGGETTVHVPADHGSGGRNQQTTLAAAEHCSRSGWPAGLLLASFGTDGEDGPTTAAGGLLDEITATSLFRDTEQLLTALKRCDAHTLLKDCGGLIETGLTGTNVADLRLLLAHPEGKRAD